jgi:hypothetical protein
MTTTEVELDLYPQTTFPITGAQSVILALFRQRGSFTDSELNDFYSANWEFQGWPQMRYDTPRKRRSELAKLSILTTDDSTRPNRFGGQEKVWTLA